LRFYSAPKVAQFTAELVAQFAAESVAHFVWNIQTNGSVYSGMGCSLCSVIIIYSYDERTENGTTPAGVE